MKRVVLFGANEVCEILLSAVNDLDMTVLAVVDSDPDRWGERIHGMKVEDPDEVLRIQPDGVIVMSMGNGQETNADIRHLENAGIRIRTL